MIVAKGKPDQGPLSAVVLTLDRMFRPDPVVPAAMMALLQSLDYPPAFAVAGTTQRIEALHP